MNRAMLVAGDRLFVAAARGQLLAYRTADGQKVTDVRTGLVAWDGLAAAGGRVYVTTAAGQVVCLGGK